MRGYFISRVGVRAAKPAAALHTTSAGNFITDP